MASDICSCGEALRLRAALKAILVECVSDDGHWIRVCELADEALQASGEGAAEARAQIERMT